MNHSFALERQWVSLETGDLALEVDLYPPSLDSQPINRWWLSEGALLYLHNILKIRFIDSVREREISRVDLQLSLVLVYQQF